MQVVKDNLFILLLDLFLLPENDIALPLDRRLFKLGVLENVGEDVDGLGETLILRELGPKWSIDNHPTFPLISLSQKGGRQKG